MPGRRRRSTPVVVIRETYVAEIEVPDTMNAKLKTRLSDGAPMVTPDQQGGMWIECEVAAPPSMDGRTVYLHVDPDQVTPMLLAFRDQARDQRMTTTAE